MATPALCYYCFETLAASYKNEEPPRLAAVEELWEQHEQAKEMAVIREKELVSQDRKDALSGSNVDWVDNSDDAEGESDIEEDNEDGGKTSDRPRTIKLPSIKRLQRGISDSSSNSTTPSSLSANSSRSALSNSTTLTSPVSQLSPYSITETPSLSGSKIREEEYPLFVTWNTISRNGHKSLRGCIGTFEAQELSYGLRSYALTSAFEDTRFSPVPSSLLPSLSCSLTLLSDFEQCTDVMDWELGRHGLRISFVYRNRRYGATYLPDVGPEQGWTKEETVESLMRKAGWTGSSSSEGMARRFLRGAGGGSGGPRKPWEEVSDFKTIRYQGLGASASYDEWQEWKKWVQSDNPREKLLYSS